MEWCSVCGLCMTTEEARFCVDGLVRCRDCWYDERQEDPSDLGLWDEFDDDDEDELVD